jgi:lysophospholipase L1-like esterase
VIRALVLASVVSAAAFVGVPGLAVAQERPWTPLPSPQSRSCPDAICQAEALAPLFRALDGRWGGVVRIVQFGDSHTAGRLITGSLEMRLKARFPARDIRIEPIGVVGVTLSDLKNHPLPVLDAPVDLIVLEYGVNEGFDDTLDTAAYERLLRGEVARLKAEAPNAAMLILGAPEAMRGEGGGSCPYDLEGRWRSPAMLAVVRDIQQRVAASMNVAWWDWRGRMGGDCSAFRLTLPGPNGEDPMMRGDHVHFTQAGADWIGSLLYDDLMTAGRQWYRGGAR